MNFSVKFKKVDWNSISREIEELLKQDVKFIIFFVLFYKIIDFISLETMCF